MSDDEQKILFQLFQDEDDWPPFSVESIWSAKLESHVYRLNNVPYFAKNISIGDVIRTQEIDEQEWFLEVQKESANSTVHVFCFDKVKRDNLQTWAKLNHCTWEYAFKQQYIALSIPPDVPKVTWIAKLNELESLHDDGLEYEVSALRHA